MRKCFNPLGIFLVLLLAATGSVLAWSSTDVFDWAMHADTEKTMGWPTGTLRLVNDPRRVLGWHAWFSELPNSVYNFAYKPASADFTNSSRVVPWSGKVATPALMVTHCGTPGNWQLSTSRRNFSATPSECWGLVCESRIANSSPP